MTAEIPYPAAVENYLPEGVGNKVKGNNEKHVDDVDFWLRTRTGVVMIGGYGEDRQALEKLVKERAKREGFDPDEVEIITMAEGLSDPEKVRRAVHDRAAVVTHSAGATVIQEAFDAEEMKGWLRPGLGYFHNPPSGHRRPLAKPSSESKEISLPQLIVGSLLVAETDKVSQPEGWRIKRWGKEVFGSRGNRKAHMKAFLSRIVKRGREFEDFAASLADRGTEVIIPVSRKDYFFHMTEGERDNLAAHGAAVVEPKVGDGYHNDVVFKPEQTTAEVDEELAEMMRQEPEGSQRAGRYETRRSQAERRRAYRDRHSTHRGAGVDEVASREAADRELEDTNK